MKPIVCRLIVASCFAFLLVVSWENVILFIEYSRHNLTPYFRHNAHHDEVSFILKPRDLIFRSDDLTLLVLVTSRPENAELRNAIRRTWSDRSLIESPNVSTSTKLNATDQPRRYGRQQPFGVVFLLGMSVHGAVNEAVAIESSKHGDIVQVELLDWQGQATRKTLAGLRWLVDHCRVNVRYVLKLVDHVIPNMKELSGYLTAQQATANKSEANTFHCLVHKETKPERGPSVWRVSRDEFAPDVYPSYCDSRAYLFSSATMVTRLLNASTNFRRQRGADRLLRHIEDVSVTGLLAHDIAAAHVDIRNLYHLDAGWQVAQLAAKFTVQRLLFVCTGQDDKSANVTRFYDAWNALYPQVLGKKLT